MKVYNTSIKMTPQLQTKLKEYRNLRQFKADEWILRKTELINEYYQQCGLSAAVIGVSGGVDSSVVLALLVEAQKQANSPLEKIVPVLLPALDFDGATNQNQATSQAEELCKKLGVRPHTFKKLNQIAKLISEELDEILDYRSTSWSRGQLVAYARTPILYNTTSVFTDAGYPALVAGTTNLSEGGYLGYVGKASDGLVDLQIISDLYKSEVYEVAEKLNLPQSILQATPTGDMFDGRDDEEVFGATYDFVELYHLWLQNGSEPELLENTQFRAAQENLEKLHQYNAHKYTYNSPSIHLDILDARIPGGWNNNPWRGNGN